MPAPGLRRPRRGHSSVGRALEWHSRGRRFDSAWLHHLPRVKSNTYWSRRRRLRLYLRSCRHHVAAANEKVGGFCAPTLLVLGSPNASCDPLSGPGRCTGCNGFGPTLYHQCWGSSSGGLSSLPLRWRCLLRSGYPSPRQPLALRKVGSLLRQPLGSQSLGFLILDAGSFLPLPESHQSFIFSPLSTSRTLFGNGAFALGLGQR